MTVIKINAITVPHESGDELAQRFAARAGAVDDADGFEGFELLKPTDGREQWLVITRWRDEESFQAWRGSESFAHGHRSAAERQGSPTPQPLARHSEVVLHRGRRIRSPLRLRLPSGRAVRGSVTIVVSISHGRRQKDDAMADDSTTIELSRSELREVADYAVACARPALHGAVSYDHSRAALRIRRWAHATDPAVP